MATSANISLGHITSIDNLATNRNFNTGVLAINQINPYGAVTQRDDHPYGMVYNFTLGRWAIYNEDSSTLPANSAWNVFRPPLDSTLIVQAAYLTNTFGARTNIDSTYFNQSPDVFIFALHALSPPLLPGAEAPSGDLVDTHTLAVVYDNGASQWAIMNADNSPMTAGTTFFALRATVDETAFKVTSSSANQVAPDGLAIDNPATNSNPDALIFVTQNHGTDLVNPAYNHPVGVEYDLGSQRWLIVNEDGTAFPNGISYNVLVIPPKTGFLVHTAAAANSTSFTTAIDNPDLNNNPYARVYVSHNWDPPESPNDLFNDHPIGVEYNGAGWSVYNLDASHIVSGTTFNVYYTLPRGNSFNFSASTVNTNGTVMTVTHPLLDQHPERVGILTQNYNPDNVAGWNYTNTVGLNYDSPSGHWTIDSPAGPSFVISSTYNLLVPPPSATLVVTSTNANTIGNDLYLDDPRTNGNPKALVFATPRDNGAMDTNNIGVWYDYSAQQWSIFNENETPMPAGQAFNVFVVERSYLYLPLIRR